MLSLGRVVVVRTTQHGVVVPVNNTSGQARRRLGEVSVNRSLSVSASEEAYQETTDARKSHLGKAEALTASLRQRRRLCDDSRVVLRPVQDAGTNKRAKEGKRLARNLVKQTRCI